MAPEDAARLSAGAEAGVSLPEDALILVPVRRFVLFPGMVLPLTIGREGSLKAAQEAARQSKPLGLLLQRDAEQDDPSPADLHEIGAVADILRYVTSPDGTHHLVCQGQQRFRVTEFLDGYGFLVARVHRLPEDTRHDAEIDARFHRLREQAVEAVQLLPDAPSELSSAIHAITSPPLLTDMIAGYMDVTPEEKQEVLEILDIKARLDRVLDLLAYRLEVLRLSHQIGERTQQTLQKQQRDYMLREQMRTIQQELGESDDPKSVEIAELADRLEKAGLPEEAGAQARRELKRLERLPEMSAEYPMVRTYLDWLLELPWSIETPDRIDLAEARRILDEDHYGLPKIKRRILEHLAVRRLAPQGKSPILCFVGPPGVGKTSFGQSIARAIGRKFVRVSLGGLHDESEIRGHRRTYVGALPGTIIQALRKADTRNPVMMLDELDKLGQGFHGDPSAALLEVLDPEQNSSFRDNYLAVPFDLSRVMFIATANMLDTIPGPLLDRLEIIELAGYTEDEKLEIAQRYLLRRQREATGLTAEQAEIEEGTLTALIHDYTREAGVRNLERQIGAVLRHVAMRIASGEGERVVIRAGDLAAILGAPRYERETAMRTSVPGVATGLAWTRVGGDILFIEASRVPGSGRLILTGQLGDVMRESAQAALSLVKAGAARMGIGLESFEKGDIHIHLPAGATPKDGPSAGVAIYMALVSLLTDRRVSSEVAMTGEITLRGLVLPVGGIKEKLVAAARAGVTRVLLPARNRADLEEVPEAARNKLSFVWLEHVEQAIEAALEPSADPVEPSGTNPPAA